MEAAKAQTKKSKGAFAGEPGRRALGVEGVVGQAGHVRPVLQRGVARPEGWCGPDELIPHDRVPPAGPG